MNEETYDEARDRELERDPQENDHTTPYDSPFN